MQCDNQCPLVEWYRFKTSCSIATCKFYTDVLVTKCIAIERKESVGKKQLTDRELAYYKFGVDGVNSVIAYRKKVQIRSKKLLILYYYVQYVYANVDYKSYTLHKKLKKFQKKFPLRLKKLNITEDLFAAMLDGNVFLKYSTRLVNDPDITLNAMLFIKDSVWKQCKQYTNIKE